MVRTNELLCWTSFEQDVESCEAYAARLCEQLSKELSVLHVPNIIFDRPVKFVWACCGSEMGCSHQPPIKQSKDDKKMDCSMKVANE